MTGEFLSLWEAGGLCKLSHRATGVILKYPRRTFREEYQCSLVVLLFYLSYTDKPSEKADEYYFTNTS